jgi:predicted nucleic acid-binding protein
MILLDTNIVSALMSDPLNGPDEEIVAEWRDRHPARDMFVSTVTRAEIAFGIELLDEGRRKDTLRIAAADFFSVLRTQTLDFTAGAADWYAHIMAGRRRTGRPMGILDAEIGAIAVDARAILATRNVKDFLDTPVRTVNPYDRTTWR